MALRCRLRFGRSEEPNDDVATAGPRDAFSVRGAETVTRLRQAIGYGNVRRIRIKDEAGRTLIEIPSLLGIRGGRHLTPVWAAVGALASESGELTVEVLREPAWPTASSEGIGVLDQAGAFVQSTPSDRSRQRLG
jgi:hypothetical protein